MIGMLISHAALYQRTGLIHPLKTTAVLTKHRPFSLLESSIP